MMERSKKFVSRFAMFMAVALAFAALGGMVGMNLKSAVAEPQEFVGYDSIYSSANPVPAIAEKVRPSVVLVVNKTEMWDRSSRQMISQENGFGSGTYIRTENGLGYILTNNHVIANANSVEIRWLDGTIMDAEIVGADDGTDLAVLSFADPAPADAQPVPMGDSDALVIGELAIVIGNPGGEELFGTTTAGIISGLGRDSVNASNFTRAVSTIQVDAAINSGNSGGALLNARGELIGVPTLKMMYSSSAVYEGLGFCVPVNTAKKIADELIEHGEVVRPGIGITASNFDGPDEPASNWPPMGVQIMSVLEDSPAETAGLQPGDVIYAVDDVRTKDFTQLTSELDKHEVGDVVKLTVYRYYDANGKWLYNYEKLELDVQLEILNQKTEMKK